MVPPARLKKSLLCACFFASGASGLLYEVLWTRILGLTFGHTVYAVTTVLGAFMGGLALGSWLLGRLADRGGRPLRLYGLLEIGIGLYCLAAPSLLSLTRDGYLSLSAAGAGGLPGKTLAQFVLAFAVLIVPTTLMGGTLPAVARALVATPPESGRTVALLYGINTLGAALGALAAGYVLLPAIGLAATNRLGVAMNLLAGVAALALSRGERASEPAGEKIPRSVPESREGPDRFLLWCFAVSGAAGMSYQIVWVRSLVLVIGSSTYAFSAILVTFLAGIALGSFLFGRFRHAEGARLFAVLQIGIALCAFLLVPLFDRLPGLFIALFKGFGGSFGTVQAIQFLVVFAVVLLPTTLMGMTFPCLAALLARRVDRFGGDIGMLYAYNTLGAIAGSVATGFFLVPRIGAHAALALAIGGNALLGAAVLLRRTSARARVPAVVVAVFAVLLLLSPRWDRKLMSSGVFTLRKMPPSMDALVGSRVKELLFFREGISSTVSVVRNDTGETALLINGKADASSASDMETQVNLANVPMLLHPSPQRVAVVGLGSGVTAGIAALYPETARIDIVEIEPAVVEASRLFAAENRGILADPRVRVRIDDGRSYFQGTRDVFDVVISEPSNPWMAGIANLFSGEFFEAVRARLAPGGIYCQWLQGYSIAPAELKMIARTFQDVFPAASLWSASEGDFLLIGHKDRVWIASPDSIHRRAAGRPGLRDAFLVYDGAPVLGLAASFLLGPPELRAFAGDGPRNTDDRPLLEFSAPRSLYAMQGEDFARIRREILGFKTGSIPPFLAGPRLDAPETHARLGKYLLGRERPDEAAAEFTKASSLGWRPGFDWRRTSWAGPVAKQPAAVRRESFDGEKPILPMFPRLGSHRPEAAQVQGFAVWAGNMELFAAGSGVVPKAGASGSAALKIVGVAGVGSAAYFAPVSVRPATQYQVEFHLKSGMNPRGEAGAGVVEYDAFLPAGEQPTQEVLRNHLVGMHDGVRVAGPRQWQRHAFSFRTSPRTRMVHLVLYREGEHDRGPVFFDDIRIAEEP